MAFVDESMAAMKETFADRVAAFVVGCIVGLVVAWWALTFEGVESTRALIGIVVGCGLLAAFAWNWMWELAFLIKDP